MAAPVTFDIQYSEERERLSNALRIFYALPHLVVLYFVQFAGEVVAFIHWWVILFTGKRNKAMWDFCYGVTSWQARAYSYAGLMYDPYPNFGFERRNEPVTYGFAYEEGANRLTNALRIFWAIPAFIILAVIGIAAWFLTVISWFAILFTGRHPRGMWDFMLKFHRLYARVLAYLYLLTDTYPKFE